MDNNDAKRNPTEFNFIGLDNAIKTCDKLYSCNRGHELITEMYERGIKLIEKLSFDCAAKVFQDALENSPQYLVKFFRNLKAVALHNSGVQLFSKERFEEAIETYNEVVISISEDFPDLATIKFNIAHATAEMRNKEGEELAKLKKNFEAIEKFQKAFKICPKKVKTRGRFKRSIANCAFELWLSNELDTDEILSFLYEALIFTSDGAGRKIILDRQVFVLNAEGNKLQYEENSDNAAIKYGKAWDLTNDTWNQKYLRKLTKSAISRKGRNVSTSEYIEELIEQNEEMKKKFLAGKMDLNDLLSFSRKTSNNFFQIFRHDEKLNSSLFELLIEVLEFLIKARRYDEALIVIAEAQTRFHEENSSLENMSKEINRAMIHDAHNKPNILNNIMNRNLYDFTSSPDKEEAKSDERFTDGLNLSYFGLSLITTIVAAVFFKYYFQ